MDAARPDAAVRDAGFDSAVDELDSGPGKLATDGVYDCVSVFYRGDTCSVTSLTVGQRFVLELDGSHAEAVDKFTCVEERLIPPVGIQYLVGCMYSGLDAPNDGCTLYIQRGDAATDIHLVFDSSGTQADCTMR